jgi:hypothetical protein
MKLKVPYELYLQFPTDFVAYTNHREISLLPGGVLKNRDSPYCCKSLKTSNSDDSFSFDL